jgi:hypothetical protein
LFEDCYPELPSIYVRFEVFRAVTMKYAVFWDVEPCSFCKPPACAGSSLTDFSTLKMEVIRSTETLVHTEATWCHIPENGILPYIFLLIQYIVRNVGIFLFPSFFPYAD